MNESEIHKFSHSNSKYRFFLRVPFDWKNPLGYSVVITFQYILTAHCLTLVFCDISFGIGCYLLLNSIIQDYVKIDLKLINKDAASNRNHSLAVKRVASFIETHSFLKKFSVFRSIVLLGARAICYRASQMSCRPIISIYM